MERLSARIRLLINYTIMATMIMLSPRLHAQDPVFMRATQGLDLIFLEDEHLNKIQAPDGSLMGMIVDAQHFSSDTGPSFSKGDPVLWQGPVDVSKANNLITSGHDQHIYCIDETHGMVEEFLVELRDGKLYISVYQSLTYANAKYGLNDKTRFFGRVDQWVFFREKGDPSNRIKYFEVGKGTKFYSIDIPQQIKYVTNVSRSRVSGQIMVHVVKRSTALISQFCVRDIDPRQRLRCSGVDH